MNNLCVKINIERLRNNDAICTQYLCWFCECEYHFLEFKHEDRLLSRATKHSEKLSYFYLLCKILCQVYLY